MKKNFTITIRNGTGRGDYEARKWDVLKMASNGGEGIVIFDPYKNGELKTLTITVYPYKRKKTKFGKWLWFKILKLKIWLKIIKQPTNKYK